MRFVDRLKEKSRLEKALQSAKAKLIIIYGRRRCGKSTLIKNTLSFDDIYFAAQQSDESIQRMQFASCIAEKLIGFDTVVYPNWESLFTNLNNTLKEQLTICIDEFPYLVKSCTGLPSTLQKIIDNSHQRKFHLILCGSSQQMMQSLGLNSSSPLYGRADEILKIQPLNAGWIGDAINLDAISSVEEYSVWGGIPRYWELRKEESSFENAIKNIVLDRYGVLHEEPSRLFLDDMRESVQAYSILSVIGTGSNRLSEIAGKLNKPATQLARPIDNLIQLGYLKREIPFGELEKNSKRGIYRISDPFMNFYFTFLTPNLSRLELGLTDQVFERIRTQLARYISLEWESLCRNSVPLAPINGINFDLARRWWGANLNNKPMELDIVAESVDKEYVLIGECKWTNANNPSVLMEQLKEKANLFPFAKNKKTILALFLKNNNDVDDSLILTASDIINRLK